MTFMKYLIIKKNKKNKKNCIHSFGDTILLCTIWITSGVWTDWNPDVTEIVHRNPVSLKLWTLFFVVFFVFYDQILHESNFWEYGGRGVFLKSFLRTSRRSVFVLNLWLYCRWPVTTSSVGTHPSQDDNALNEVLLRNGRRRQASETSTLPNGRVSEEEQLDEVLRRSILDLSLREILKDSDLVSYPSFTYSITQLLTHSLAPSQYRTGGGGGGGGGGRGGVGGGGRGR
jgi:uncharacterized membrane protein YgcG